MRWLLVVLVLEPSPAVAQDYPPAYPRPGAAAMLENDRVIVWNIAWLQQEYPVHRHRYDHVGVYYTTGDRIITSLEGERRPITTQAWNISFQLRDVTHAEEGASANPLRAVFVQIKDEPRAGPAENPSVPRFPVSAPTQRLDNDRTTVWEYGPGSARTPVGEHYHAYDAVVVSFDAMLDPEVRYVERGTVHETDLTAGARRTVVFEIK